MNLLSISSIQLNGFVQKSVKNFYSKLEQLIVSCAFEIIEFGIIYEIISSITFISLRECFFLSQTDSTNELGNFFVCNHPLIVT